MANHGLVGDGARLVSLGVHDQEAVKVGCKPVDPVIRAVRRFRPTTLRADMHRTSSTIHLSVGARTDAGRVRPNNQDWWLQFVPPDPRVLAAKGALFAVADGMGGRAGGQMASQLAVQHVLQAYYHNPSLNPSTSLTQAVQVANHQVYSYGQFYPAYRGMATTLVAAVVRGSELVVAHVGDSRAYLVRAGRVWPLTRDHSWVAEMVARGLLTPAQGASHPYRHVITRSVGPKPAVAVDVQRTKIAPGDALVLCTDGLSDVVSSGEIGWAAATLDPQHAAQTLIDWANQRGGRDNISALVVRVQQPAVHRAGQDHTAARQKPHALVPVNDCPVLSYSGGMVQLLVGVGLAAVGIGLAMATLAALY